MKTIVRLEFYNAESRYSLSRYIQRQSPVELETEFILNVAAAFNEITIEEVKPNLYCFAPPVSFFVQ
jgi:hypothetical protein